MDNSISHKICALCKEELPVSAFYRHRATSTGYASRCKKCHKKYNKGRQVFVPHSLAGQSFGEWTVTETPPVRRHLGGKSPTRFTYDFCQCNCGTTRWVNRTDLVRGASKSCGCLHYTPGPTHPTFKGVGAVSRTYWKNVLSNAHVRGLAVEVSLEDVAELFEQQRHLCALTGVPLEFAEKVGTKGTTASLDRIDSTKGYIKHNVQWVHKDVNIWKGNRSEEKLIQMCRKILQIHQSKQRSLSIIEVMTF